MISESLAFITNQLNSYCRRHYQLDDDFVVLSDINNDVSKLNKIIISLVNIEKDSTYLKHSRISSVNQIQTRSAPPLQLNLHIVLAANFEDVNYQQGLKVLSSCIRFLNTNPLFDRNNSPTMNENIEKLVFEIENLNISELSNLWGVLGSHYLPSIYYKVHTIGFDSDNSIERI